MAIYYDIHKAWLKKAGEELCGDQVKISRAGKRTIAVLSDGLGSGVKANILATLTAEIVSTMIREGMPFKEVITTVIGTLPECRERKLAYATFTVLDIDEESNGFKVINFDNPPVMLFREGRLLPLFEQKEIILGKEITLAEGEFEPGDFFALLSDGILYASEGEQLDFGWGWDEIARFAEEQAIPCGKRARAIVDRVMEKTAALYNKRIGDDATFVGVLVRERKSLIIFTGPPLKEDSDESYAKKFLGFEGRRVICGGTTADIVGRYMGEEVKTDISTMSEEVPPVGELKGVDLVTEGILTLAKTLPYLEGEYSERIARTWPKNGAALLAQEMFRADHIHFLAGQTMNPYYQNPLLPKDMSIRTNLVKELEKALRGLLKEVTLEFC